MIDSKNANKVFFSLLFTGYPVSKIPLAMKQAAFETDGFTSNLGVSSNNWSGIEKRLWEQGVSNQDSDDRFSHFNKVSDWARAYHHILENFHPAAYTSTNLDDFGNALYNSGYVKQESKDDTASAYIKGMKKYSPDVDYFIKAKELMGVHIGMVILVAIIVYLYKISSK